MLAAWWAMEGAWRNTGLAGKGADDDGKMNVLSEMKIVK
jgi:hypothetical protein